MFLCGRSLLLWRHLPGLRLRRHLSGLRLWHHLPGLRLWHHLPGLRLCLYRTWLRRRLSSWRRRRSPRLRLGTWLRTRLKTRLRRRRFPRFRLGRLNLRSHFSLRLWSLRFAYAFALRLLLSLTLRTLRLDILFSLLLLELLRLLARISVASRRFGSNRGHLLFARGISRRIRLPGILIQRNLPFVLQVQFLILSFLRHLLHAQ